MIKTILSGDRIYRYTLHRFIGGFHVGSGDACIFIMCNPSTADVHADDPTIRRCMRFAELFEYPDLYVINLFAYRTPLKKDLLRVQDPVGPLNDDHVADVITQATPHSLFIAGWGKLPGDLRRREKEFMETHHCKLYCLGVNRDGTPTHPLFVPYSAKLRTYRNDNTRAPCPRQ